MMKKVLHGLLVLGAAAVVSVAATAYNADAKGITPTNYEVDYANQKINVKGADANTKIYVAKATVTVKKDGTMTVKNAVATEYDYAAGLAIDLSSFAVTKDIYVSIWGNVTTDPTLIKLPAATTKMKAVVDAVDSTVAINDITDAKNPVEISGTEFCTTNGVWTEYTKAAAGKVAATTSKTTTVKLTDYAQLGATLRFRVKASAAAKLAAAVEIGKDAEGNSVKACVGAGNFASNEVKAKIAKTANGPKATIDYSKNLIKIPVTAEYRVQLPGATLAKTFTVAPQPEKGSVATLDASAVITDKTKGAEFDLRTIATDKKPASKITEYTFASIGTITAQTGKNTAISTLTQDVTDSKIKDADVKVTKMTINSKTMAGTMTVQNNTTDVYEFVVADAPGVAKYTDLAKVLPAADAKVTGKVAANKSANIAVKSGQYVYVRKAGDAKKMTWSTPYVFYGIVSNTLG